MALKKTYPDTTYCSYLSVSDKSPICYLQLSKPFNTETVCNKEHFLRLSVGNVMKMNSEYDESSNLLEISPWINNNRNKNATTHNAIGLGYSHA